MIALGIVVRQALDEGQDRHAKERKRKDQVREGEGKIKKKKKKKTKKEKRRNNNNKAKQNLVFVQIMKTVSPSHAPFALYWYAVSIISIEYEYCACYCSEAQRNLFRNVLNSILNLVPIDIVLVAIEFKWARRKKARHYDETIGSGWMASIVSTKQLFCIPPLCNTLLSEAKWVDLWFFA